ncbi:uncharacterized protein LOC126565598 [Anopheles maculipalpis]|uniref:uncharacterized protein LOC126565598 n=1 Tax=Anopheles maculipalpis TaxID=1496333 RepID=UPI0021594321|nr:uncharacterized protein LOC126565598 [Anopheles maculipalpis]
MDGQQLSDRSKILRPGFSRKQLIPIYEKTKLLRTVLEKQLNFSNTEESKGHTVNEKTDPSLGILLPHEMDFGSFRYSFGPCNPNDSSNIADSILSDAQMAYNSFETSGSKINIEYLLKRLQHQIILHNTLLDASEKFPKSASIENLVKQCMKGTEALNALKQRVSAYKKVKQATRKSAQHSIVHELPGIIHNTIRCAEELQQLSQEIVQLSGSIDADLLNRSTATAQSIQDASGRLKEIEQMWENMPSLDDEEESSLGLLHESEMEETGHFLDSVSNSLNSTFEKLNHSLEEVLQTPNTESLNKLKANITECSELLSHITQNHSLLMEETMPSVGDSLDQDEISFLHTVTGELDKSCQSEIEAFLQIWKKPEMEQFLHISKQTIDDLSNLRDETNEMLKIAVASNGNPKQPSHRREHLIEQLNVLRDAGTKAQKPIYTSILMKDYIDEDDLCAEQQEVLVKESFPKTHSLRRTVQFTDHVGETTPGVLKHSQIPDQIHQQVESRLKILVQEIDNFQEKFLNANENAEGHQNTAAIEKKLDRLMSMISELVKTLRSK